MLWYILYVIHRTSNEYVEIWYKISDQTSKMSQWPILHNDESVSVGATYF